MKSRHFLKLLDLSASEIRSLLDLGHRLKQERNEGREKKRLVGKNIALIFEKSSTRTRCAFETAATDQGAHCTYLGPSGSQIGVKESMKDTARVLGRMYDAIEYRGFGQVVVEELAAHAGVPVWNGLTNEFHPTQVLADFLTMEEHSGKKLSEMKLTYMGDGGNNVAASLMVGCATMGVDFAIGAPEACRPDAALVDRCLAIAGGGSELLLTDDTQLAVRGADFVYTDVWVSMGEPESRWQERIALLRDYQVNRSLMQATENLECKFLHCLPAFHNRDTTVGEDIYQKFGIDGMEVSEEVFESPASVVFDQAENRVHSIKAVMVASFAS